MDEKLGIRFRKMQKCKIIHILHFCLRKEVKFIKCRLRQSLNFVYLQKTKILILHLCCHKNHFYPATQFRNIMNDLQTQFEHSVFNSG